MKQVLMTIMLLLNASLQAWAENKVPMMPPGGDLSKDRKVEQKVDPKKKTQAEIEQEMAALQYTNPMLLEVGGATLCSY